VWRLTKTDQEWSEIVPMVAHHPTPVRA